MTEDRYALKLENEIKNMAAVGKNAAVYPVINMLSLCLRNNMYVFVPTKEPEAVRQARLENRKLDPNEKINVEFLQIRAKDSDMFYSPVFTSLEEAKKGQKVPFFKFPLKSMLDTIDAHPKCKGFLVNPWGIRFVIPRETAKNIGKYVPHAILSIVKADRMALRADAFVNDTDSTLFGGNSSSNEMFEAAGPALLDEIWTLQGCEVGQAKITSACNLENAGFIIHTVTPKFDGNLKSMQDLARCYTSSLDLAYERGFTSIVFPCLGSASGKFPLEQSSVISVNAVMKWIRLHPGAAMNVYICCADDTELKAYAAVAKNHRST